jgi:hypothetical protein
MLTGKIRISIITAVAALSVASVGPFASVASARRPMKIGKIQIDCPVRDDEGKVIAWAPEGTWMHEGKTNYICLNGEWVAAQEAPSTPQPPTTVERPTTPPVLAP